LDWGKDNRWRRCGSGRRDATTGKEVAVAAFSMGLGTKKRNVPVTGPRRSHQRGGGVADAKKGEGTKCSQKEGRQGRKAYVGGEGGDGTDKKMEVVWIDTDHDKKTRGKHR